MLRDGWIGSVLMSRAKKTKRWRRSLFPSRGGKNQSEDAEGEPKKIDASIVCHMSPMAYVRIPFKGITADLPAFRFKTSAGGDRLGTYHQSRCQTVCATMSCGPSVAG